MQSKKPGYHSYMKYSGMAMQLFVLFMIAIYGGQWLDEKFGLSDPWFTIFLIVFFFAAWFYRLYIDISRKP